VSAASRSVKSSKKTVGNFRYPVGRHAPGVFTWRAGTSDEEWVRLFGGEDGEWVPR
jgi:hypothetical protein